MIKEGSWKVTQCCRFQDIKSRVPGYPVQSERLPGLRRRRQTRPANLFESVIEISLGPIGFRLDPSPVQRVTYT